MKKKKTPITKIIQRKEIMSILALVLFQHLILVSWNSKYSVTDERDRREGNITFWAQTVAQMHKFVHHWVQTYQKHSIFSFLNLQAKRTYLGANFNILLDSKIYFILFPHSSKQNFHSPFVINIGKYFWKENN